MQVKWVNIFLLVTKENGFKEVMRRENQGLKVYLGDGSEDKGLMTRQSMIVYTDDNKIP